MARKPFIRNGRLTSAAQEELSTIDLKKMGGSQQEKTLDALKAHNAGSRLSMSQAEALLDARSFIRKD